MNFFIVTHLILFKCFVKQLDLLVLVHPVHNISELFLNLSLLDMVSSNLTWVGS